MSAGKEHAVLFSALIAILASSNVYAGKSILEQVRDEDERIDAGLNAVSTVDELDAYRREWRTRWIAGLGGLPERIPLNAKEGPLIGCDGFTLQNVLFESMPGVYVVGHLCLPSSEEFAPPYPVVMMPLGHSDAGILLPRYAAHLAMMARAGFAAFAWDPVSQGERRQAVTAKYDYTDNCSTEHSRLGARGWLVGWNFARFRIWDAMRAVDYVMSRPDLDCSKLGVCGTSGGGTMSAYMLALDDRIKVAFPNCYISSFREVFGARGCHDAEQFYFNQLNDGVNHAAILAMGVGRVAIATGSRHADYFPHAGAVSTFAVVSNLNARMFDSAPLWHFHCAGPHGLPLPTRAAQCDWMKFCIQGGEAPKPVEEYWRLSSGDHTASDPANSCPLPFGTNETYMAGGQVRRLVGFKSLYTLIAERAEELRQARSDCVHTPEELGEIVRRRAGIRPLEELKTLPVAEFEPFDHPRFGWWYLKGPFGHYRENEAAMLSVMGRSVVGRDAERIISAAAAQLEKTGRRQTLMARGWECIAAAHAYAAEPQLFDAVEFAAEPPSWTAMVQNADPANDSYAIGVWGALEEYDWTDLVPPSVRRAPPVSNTMSSTPAASTQYLADGKLNPTCVWSWNKKPIEIVADFGTEREIGGVRFWAGRSWISCGVRKASFYALDEAGQRPLAEHVEFRPAHTFKQSFATWPRTRCRRVKMVVEGAWETDYGYYMWYMHLATPEMQRLLDSPPYTLPDNGRPKVEIAELEYFGDEPDDLPKPNADGSIAYPDSRLVFDWLLQSCAVSNVSHCASVERDTAKPDPLGEDMGALLERKGADARELPKAARGGALGEWRHDREVKRREFLRSFRSICDEFVYVKHLVIGNSIMHATDDMTDASFLEWRGIPDYRTGSQLIRAKIEEDGSVTQRVLVDEPDGIIRDPSLSIDAKYVVFAKRSSMTNDNYHLWKYEFDGGRLTQLTFEPYLCRREAAGLAWRSGAFVPGQTNEFRLVCSDTEPCVLPDGSIVFQSTRVCHSVDCWPLPTTNLYRCDPDGSNIRRVGFDQIQTFYPQLLEDGRVAYTRWEYQDRSAAGVQQLCAMNPDGTRQTGLFGNNSEWPFSYIHCRSVPGTEKLVALLCGHHVAQKGKLVMMNPAEGDDFDNQTYDPARSLYGVNTNDVVMHFPGKDLVISHTRWDSQPAPCVTNVPGLHYIAGSSLDVRPGMVPAKHPKEYHYNVYDMCSQFGPQWAYPCALDEDHLLVSYMPEGCRYYRGPYSSRFGIYATDRTGRRELLAFDWGNHCMQPVAVRARKYLSARKGKKLDYREGFGTYYVHNVYHGAASKGLAKGEVKKLRVIALEYRPVHNGWNWQYGTHSTQGKIGTPIAVGNGCYDVKHVLGEAEVEADGSCMFRCPARTPVYFQLIDAQGHCVQTMRSWSTLMPGEANSCIGCHEHPGEAAPTTATLASKRAPQRLGEAIPGRGTHPLLARLEKEGPLASLENWMGVNRPMKAPVERILKEGIPAEERGDGFGFVKDVQPIFDRLLRDRPGFKLSGGLDLRDVPAALPPSDDKSMRTYSKAYLEFTDNGKCDDNVNFAHGMGGAAFKPPKSFGALSSKRYHEIAPLLTDAERRTLAMWIDLAIPYCSCYTERHTWDAWHQQRYLYTYDKRIFSYWLELDEIRRSLGMPSVPLSGFVPNVTEPAKQKNWYD